LPGSSKYKGLSLGLLLVILAAAVVLMSNAPHERTLGPGILPVYVHVSLTWAGMLFFILSAVLGVLVVFTGGKSWFSWLRPVFMTAYITYLAGFLVSLWASYVNWNGIPYREPRVLSALNAIVVTSVCAVLLLWLRRKWMAGIVAVIPAFFVMSAVQSTRLVLHPDNPIRQAPAGIRNTFITMFGLVLLLSVWLVWVQRLLWRERAGN
jgi:hypothetical protein